MNLRSKIILFIGLMNIILVPQVFAQAPFNKQTTPKEIQERFRHCGNVRIMNSSSVTVHDVLEAQARTDFAECSRWATELHVKVGPMKPKAYSIDGAGFLKMIYQVRITALDCEDAPAFEDYEITVESLLRDSENIRCDYKSIR